MKIEPEDATPMGRYQAELSKEFGPNVFFLGLKCGIIFIGTKEEQYKFRWRIWGRPVRGAYAPKDRYDMEPGFGFGWKPVKNRP